MPRRRQKGTATRESERSLPLTMPSRNSRASMLPTLNLLPRACEDQPPGHPPGANGGVSNHPPSLSFWPRKASAVWAAWENGFCWTCLQHSDRGLGDAHRAPAGPDCRIGMLRGGEGFSKPGLGSAPWCIIPMGHTHTHTQPASPPVCPLEILCTLHPSYVRELWIWFLESGLPQCPEARPLSRYGVLSRLRGLLALVLMCTYNNVSIP